MRSGATSVAVIEPELSIARITVASSRGTATATCGRAMPTHERRQREQRERGRNVPPPAGRALDDVLEQVEVREADDVAPAPPLHERRSRGGRAGRARARAARRPGEAHRRLPSTCRKPTRRPQPVAAGREDEVRDAERAQLAGELLALGRGLRAEPLPQLAAAGVDAQLPPVSGSTSQSSPTSGSSCSRGSRISTAITSWRAASRSSGVRQSRGPRKSETTTTTERRRASRPSRRERGPRATSARPARDRARAAARASSGSSPRPPCRGGEAAGCRSPNVATAEAVAAARGEVADRERDALGDVPLAAVGGAEGHRRGRVEQQPRLDRPLGDVHAHVRLARAGGHVPVDQPDVVAERRTGGPGRARSRRRSAQERWSPASRPSIRRRTVRSTLRSSAVGQRRRGRAARACEQA